MIDQISRFLAGCCPISQSGLKQGCRYVKHKGYQGHCSVVDIVSEATPTLTTTNHTCLLILTCRAVADALLPLGSEYGSGFMGCLGTWMSYAKLQLVYFHPTAVQRTLHICIQKMQLCPWACCRHISEHPTMAAKIVIPDSETSIWLFSATCHMMYSIM